MSYFSWPYPPPPNYIDEPVRSVGVSGDRFTINGKVQHIRGFTDFAGLDVFRRTGQLSPLALQMQVIHHDFVSLTAPILSPRTLCMKNKGSLFDLDPREIGDYYDLLDRHADAMNKAGFIPLYVLLADCAANGMNLAYQQEFVGKAAERLRNHVCLVELVNEYNNDPQQVDPLKFDRPDGLCISRGSGTPDATIPTPDWSWRAFHERRDFKWLSDIADAVIFFKGNGYQGASMDTEPRGCGTSKAERYISTADSFALGAISALWLRSGTFHSDSGTTSAVMPDDQRNCAITFFRGMMAIPEVP